MVLIDIQSVEYYNLKLRITPDILKACKGEIMSGEMEKRLKALEDLEEIRNLHNEYIFFLNNRQWDDMADSFTSDAFADIHGQCKGREEIRKALKERIAKLNSGKGRDSHFAVQPVISINGDRATGHWLMYIFIADAVTGNAGRWIQNRHDCEYAREDGRWKFKSLVLTFPWPPESI